MHVILQVNTNGILSFRNSFTSPLQQQTFPLGSGVLIAPFWDNIDILIAGQILYRFSNNITLLEEVGSSINDGSGFSPSLLFIATWDRVAMNDEPNEDMVQKHITLTNTKSLLYSFSHR